MNLRNLALFGATVLLAAAAHAQAGVYASVTAQRLSSIQYTNGSTTATNGQVNPLGVTFGAFYDFMNLGPARIGIDARGVVTRTPRGVLPTANGSGAHVYSALGGVRASFHTPIRILRPYVEGAAGMGRTDYGLTGPSSGSSPANSPNVPLSKGFEYHGYVGLDLAVSPLIDVRAFELGAGALTGTGSFSGTHPLNSISAGIIFHLPR